MKKKLILSSLFILFFVVGFVSQSQAVYPEKNITLIITWGAGGGADTAYRQLAVPLGKILGTSIVVQNITGGGGTIGMNKIVRSKPDGYTIGCVTGGPTIIQPWLQKLPYDPVRDLTPIVQVVGVDFVIAAKIDASYNNLKEMVEYFKKSGKTPKVAVAGTGSENHLHTILTSQKIGLPMTPIPFTSSAEAITNVMGGNVDLASAEPTTVAGAMKEGRVKCLAVFSSERLDILKDVPTAKEQGFDLTFGGWNGLVAPKGTPKAIIDKLYNAVLEAVKDETFLKQSETILRKIELLPGSDFAERIKSELARNGELMKAAGLVK